MQSDEMTIPLPPTKLLITVDQAAEALSIGRSAMYALLLNGEVPSIKIGRVRRVPLYGLEAFIRRRLAADVALAE